MINSLFLLIKFIILGVIQGFTEPLPISSSGHLVLLRHFFNVETYGLTFEIIVHFGSLLAVIMVYRRDLITLVKESFLYLQKRENKYATSFRFSSYLLLATFMTCVLGLLLENFISDTLSKVSLMKFSKSSPNTPVISVAKRRYELNRKLVAYLFSLLENFRNDSLTSVIRSLRYTIITANNDPKWTMISKVRPYVSTLKKCRKRT